MFESKRQKSKEVESVFPLINIIFLLIVFFLVAGRISSNQWQVTPPVMKKQVIERDRSLAKKCTVYLKKNAITYNAGVIDLNKWSELTELKKQCGNQGIIIAASDDLPAQRMIEFLDQAKEQGFKKVSILVMSRY
ncbi:ExbD/TolR family protein [Piscirickettsia salmonis]|uniref:ExbD/TolR family protein n=1 Tax=Piscirickettsia salmonis TaxID=1238 RepID=UPI0018ACD560|nr:biopolymer transporter ExbD [Piscirickettsia salmonis]QGP39579.1 protein TolR [Piscirickettsia salmonis]